LIVTSWRRIGHVKKEYLQPLDRMNSWEDCLLALFLFPNYDDNPLFYQEIYGQTGAATRKAAESENRGGRRKEIVNCRRNYRNSADRTYAPATRLRQIRAMGFIFR
jgi:hypothetical protein